jgi:N-acyl-D-amino-acid deacylase
MSIGALPRTVAALSFLLAAGLPAQSDSRTLLIRGAAVHDGSGGPPRSVAVRVAGDRIVAVGRLTPTRGDSVVDAAGLVLAPGFIDTHSHHGSGLGGDRAALAATSQGITTIVVGQDGGSYYPLRTFFARLDSTPAAINVASYTGHGTLREAVMDSGFRRMASDREIARMRQLLREELAAGALGLSSGLEYDPGIYSTTAELVALAREAAAVGARYASHIRSEDRAFWGAVDELLTIGRVARLPVHLSHAKLAMRSLWGGADSLRSILDRARAEGIRVTADVYPYAYWQSTLTVLFPDRDFTNRRSAEFALTETTTADGALVANFAPNRAWAGKTIAEIAALRGTDAPQTLMDLIAMTQNGALDESVIATSMDEGDIRRLLAWPWANICSDGSLRGRHPRGWGSFPRVLRMAREGSLPLSLAEVIHKMTGLAAANVGLVGRGLIAPGMAADLVLFDPSTVADRATPADPNAASVGVTAVWVNGRLVQHNGVPTGLRPGRTLRRGVQ